MRECASEAMEGSNSKWCASHHSNILGEQVNQDGFVYPYFVLCIYVHGRLFPTRVFHRELNDLAHSKHEGCGGAPNRWPPARDPMDASVRIYSAVFKTLTMLKCLMCIPLYGVPSIDATADQLSKHGSDRTTRQAVPCQSVSFSTSASSNFPFSRALSHVDFNTPRPSVMPAENSVGPS